MTRIRAFRADDTVLSEGTYATPLDCGPVYRDASGSPEICHIAADVGYQRLGAYAVTVVGTYASRYRLSDDLVTWTDWGGTLTLDGPITATPTVIYVQKRALAGDPTGADATRAQLSLPQDSIVVISSGDLGSYTETGIGLDADGTFVAVIPLVGDDTGAGAEAGDIAMIGALVGDDAPEAADSGLLTAAGSLEGTDAAEGSDTGSVSSIILLTATADGGEGGDTGAVVAIIPIAGDETGSGSDIGVLETGIPYSYSQDVSIVGATGAGTDYQICFTVAKPSQSGDVVLGNDPLAWPNDIAFKTQAGVNCPYWRESYDANVQTVWVKVPLDLGSNQTIVLHYGYADADDISSGDDTFIFFDDFPGASLDTTNKWTVSAGDVTVTGGELVLTGTTGTRGTAIAKTGGCSVGSALRSKFRSSGSFADRLDNCHYAGLADTTSLADWIGAWGNAATNSVQLRCGNNASYNAATNHAFSDFSTGAVIELRWESAKVAWYDVTAGSEIKSETNASYIPAGATMYAYHREGNTANADGAVDWEFIRKYQSSEPHV